MKEMTLYVLFRLLAVLLIIAVILLVRGKMPQGKQWWKLILMFFVGWLALQIYPFENLFSGFDSPLDAYQYSINSGPQNARKQIVGENIAIIFSDSPYGPPSRTELFVKGKNGWLLNSHLGSIANFQSSSIVSEYIEVEILKAPQYSECLLIVESSKYRIEELGNFPTRAYDATVIKSIEDSLGSQFKPFSANTNYYHYGFVKSIDSNYRLFINGIDVTDKLALPPQNSKS